MFVLVCFEIWIIRDSMDYYYGARTSGRSPGRMRRDLLVSYRLLANSAVQPIAPAPAGPVLMLRTKACLRFVLA